MCAGGNPRLHVLDPVQSGVDWPWGYSLDARVRNFLDFFGVPPIYVEDLYHITDELFIRYPINDFGRKRRELAKVDGQVGTQLHACAVVQSLASRQRLPCRAR